MKINHGLDVLQHAHMVPTLQLYSLSVIYRPVVSPCMKQSKYFLVCKNVCL